MLRHSLRAFTYVLIAIMVSSCCCSVARWRYGHVPDKLETVAVLGFGDRSECVVPNKERPLLIATKTSHPLWVRMVFADNLQKPVSGRDINLSVVNTFGEPAAGIAVSPTSVVTNGDGFEGEPITIRGNDIGVYRIRAEYADKKARGFSYSPAVVVANE